MKSAVKPAGKEEKFFHVQNHVEKALPPRWAAEKQRSPNGGRQGQKKRFPPGGNRPK
ncbi:MAG TPA: hypothetical protein H9682_03285 [Firmicutes bacterium]|nr:hypothetical protein [Bacillota bacterium]